LLTGTTLLEKVMGNGFRIALGTAMLAGALYSANATAAGMHGLGRGGFSHDGFHGGWFHGHRVIAPFPFNRFGPGPYGDWGGGGIAAGGDYENGDYVAADEGLDGMHFRVQEPFGPGDLGRPMPPPPDSGPWDTARLDPSNGYEPQD
jgi:hypothetical protein